MGWRTYRTDRNPRWQGKDGVAVAVRSHGGAFVAVIVLRRDVLEVMGITCGETRPRIELEVGRMADAGLLRLRPAPPCVRGVKLIQKGKGGHGEVLVAASGITAACKVTHRMERLVPGKGWRWGEDGWLYLRRPAWLPPLECDAGKGE